MLRGATDPRGMLEFATVVLAALRASLRRRTDLVAENLLLRHQLAVLTRPMRKRAKVRPRDKLLWVVAHRLCPDWRRRLVMVRPYTVVGWQARVLF
jgi:hypothetical protein